MNTVELNSGGNPTLIRGPWAPGYGLGSHGLDASTHTVWAVVDHQGAFAVGPMP